MSHQDKFVNALAVAVMGAGPGTTLGDIADVVQRRMVAPATTEAYVGRAHCVALVVAFAQLAGHKVGVAEDKLAGAGWPVVYVDLPTGQVSWHLSQQDFNLCFPHGLPPYKGEWDGHDTNLKNQRCIAYVQEVFDVD